MNNGQTMFSFRSVVGLLLPLPARSPKKRPSRLVVLQRPVKNHLAVCWNTKDSRERGRRLARDCKDTFKRKAGQTGIVESMNESIDRPTDRSIHPSLRGTLPQDSRRERREWVGTGSKPGRNRVNSTPQLVTFGQAVECLCLYSSLLGRNPTVPIPFQLFFSTK